MMTSPITPVSLTGYEAALDQMLSALSPVPAQPVALQDALGLTAAELLNDRAYPPHAIAALDGWACRALDLVGAGPLSPLPLFPAPEWVEVGQALPAGCDAVLAPDLVQAQGPLWLACAEALPGEGVIRPGEHLAGDRPILHAGRTITLSDILLAQATGLTHLPCHAPTVHLIDVTDHGQERSSTCFIRVWLKAAGARIAAESISDKGQDQVAQSLKAVAADLTVLIGGTGQGRRDATIAGMAAAGRVAIHRIGYSSGQTAAMGWLDRQPMIALPGAPDAAVACCYGLLMPVVQRLTGCQPAPLLELPLLRKISSDVGMAELVLLAREEQGWLPLSTGRLSLDQLRRADGWLVVPSQDEGYPAGALIGARPLGNRG